MTRDHRHRVNTTDVRPFRGPVANRSNPAAHGNIELVDRCKCGAVRRTNANGFHVERGRWEDDPD